MEYQLMEPPFKPIPFKEMNKKEAQKHFDWFLDQVPERIKLLNNAIQYTTRSSESFLDYSKESLIALWGWFLPRIETIQKTKEELEREVERVPDWMKEEARANNVKVSTGSLTIAMDIAIYFSEVCVRNFEGIKWDFVTKPKSLNHVNAPILVGFRGDNHLDSRLLVHNLVLKAFQGERNNQALYNLFNVWKTFI